VLVGRLVPAGSMFAFLAAHRQDLFGAEDFADLSPPGRGPPSFSAGHSGWSRQPGVGETRGLANWTKPGTPTQHGSAVRREAYRRNTYARRSQGSSGPRAPGRG
jgi:hypothetical protein